MNNYVTFSKFYDEIMGDRNNDIKIIHNLIYQNNPNAKKILDVACGTGYLLKYFNDIGFEVVGVDISEEMLMIAKDKVPKVKLYQQNMSELNIEDTFDAITCVFDSINHVLDFNDWKNFFTLSFKHLNNNGVFIFDMNTILKLEDLSKSEPFSKIIKNKTLTMKINKFNDSIFNWNIKILEKINNDIFTYEEDIKETSFKIEEVEIYLKNIFKKVIKTDQNGGEITDISKRVFFICSK